MSTNDTLRGLLVEAMACVRFYRGMGRKFAEKIGDLPDRIDAALAEPDRDEEHLHTHPRFENDKRDEIELFIRDAYAAGCNAQASRSMLTALEYAKIHAPKLRAALSGSLAGGVVLPERSNERGSDGELTYEAKAHNRCLDQFAALNGGAVAGKAVGEL